MFCTFCWERVEYAYKDSSQLRQHLDDNHPNLVEIVEEENTSWREEVEEEPPRYRRNR